VAASPRQRQIAADALRAGHTQAEATLTAAGYGVEWALVLATHVEVDLHLATDLLRRGCPPETAPRILL
jgi:hypothetical protein